MSINVIYSKYQSSTVVLYLLGILETIFNNINIKNCLLKYTMNLSMNFRLPDQIDTNIILVCGFHVPHRIIHMSLKIQQVSKKTLLSSYLGALVALNN